jgi:N-acetylneuraminate synthase/sialic acid synthase
MKRLDKGVGKISSFNILNYKVNHDSKCFIIAEIGHNHQGNLDTCIEMFKSAKLNGADAVKLQKRENKSLYSSKTYNAIYNSENSYGRTYGEHREFLEFQKSDYEFLIQVANDLGIVFFATAFDIPSADFLMELDMPAIKIASGDLRSVQLLEHCSKFQKPMIISTGASEIKDVSRAADLINSINTNLAILQCTAEYPANYSHLDLRIIQEYSTMFPNNVIGYSGHENGIAMPLAAFALGARIIDHAFSLEPTGLRKLRRDLDRLHLALGDGVKKIYEEEMAPLTKMSKKIVAKTFIEKNQVVKSSDIDFKIANSGLWPYQTEEVIGKRARNIIEIDSTITTDDIY